MTSLQSDQHMVHHLGTPLKHRHCKPDILWFHTHLDKEVELIKYWLDIEDETQEAGEIEQSGIGRVSGPPQG
jgi:hypothetical protein